MALSSDLDAFCGECVMGKRVQKKHWKGKEGKRLPVFHDGRL